MYSSLSDDGLSAFNKTPQEIERIKKDICKIFRDNDLKITVEANQTKVNFLDVTLDLKSGKHSPHTKEGNTPLYVHKQSNHPTSIIRNIPKSINKRLSEISSDKDCFDRAKDTYVKVATSTHCHTKRHPLIHHERARTVKETSCGLTRHSAKM